MIFQSYQLVNGKLIEKKKELNQSRPFFKKLSLEAQLSHHWWYISTLEKFEIIADFELKALCWSNIR